MSEPADRVLHVDLLRLGFLLTGSREQGEGLAQDAFAALAGRGSEAADIIDTLAYLRRIVVNRSASYHRRRFRDRLRPASRENVVAPPKVDEPLGTVKSDLHRALDRLRKELS